jgi:prepilin-type N-terminal cleavage/methylation domain-containing protein/prepilin-type processing-associated H-X9-DG protein
MVCRNRKDSANAGFTFTELLVVTAVIGILAGVLLPALTSAKSRVQSIKCKSNLRQLGLATSMYWIEFEKPFAKLPPPHNWMPTLLRYEGPSIEEISICPRTKRFPPTKTFPPPRVLWEAGTVDHTWIVGENNGPAWYEGSYAINAWIYKKDEHTPGIAPLPSIDLTFSTEASFAQPSLTPFFVDSLWLETWPYELDRPARNLFKGDIVGYGAGLHQVAIPRHGARFSSAWSDFAPTNKLPGAVNVVFADNHVDTVHLEKLWQLSWHSRWVTRDKRFELAGQ